MRFVRRSVQSAERAAGIDDASKFFAQPPVHVRWKIHTGGWSRRYVRAKPGQCINKRMYRSAALQVACYGHVEVFEIFVFFLQGEQIAECLRRMLMTAVTTIYDGDA